MFDVSVDLLAAAAWINRGRGPEYTGSYTQHTHQPGIYLIHLLTYTSILLSLSLSSSSCLYTIHFFNFFTSWGRCLWTLCRRTFWLRDVVLADVVLHFLVGDVVLKDSLGTLCWRTALFIRDVVLTETFFEEGRCADRLLLLGTLCWWAHGLWNVK